MDERMLEMLRRIIIIIVVVGVVAIMIMTKRFADDSRMLAWR